MVRRTKEAALETRDHIIDTAERVFEEKGVSHTTLADIAKAAGLTRGAIYWHFKNKADLFQAMMDRIKLPMEHTKASCSAALEDPLAFVHDCALGVLKQITSDPQTQRVFEICCHKVEYVDEMTHLRERHIECRSEFLTQLERGLRQAGKQGLLAAGVNPRYAAVGLHALVDGLIMNWVLDPKYFPLARAAGPMIERYIDSLKTQTSKLAPAKVAKQRALK
jgi:TetR/AcrR family acrAB operon transcriptional repressor